MLPSTLISLFVPLLNWFWRDDSLSVDDQVSATPSLHFQLRHLHAVTNTSRIVFSDVSPARAALYTTRDLSKSIRTRRLKTTRLSSQEAYSYARTRSRRFGENAPLDWEEDEVLGPDVTSRETLLLLAQMTSNAYYEVPGTPGWYELGDGWNVVSIRYHFLVTVCI